MNFSSSGNRSLSEKTPIREAVLTRPKVDRFGLALSTDAVSMRGRSRECRGESATVRTLWLEFGEPNSTSFSSSKMSSRGLSVIISFIAASMFSITCRLLLSPFNDSCPKLIVECAKGSVSSPSSNNGERLSTSSDARTASSSSTSLEELRLRISEDDNATRRRSAFLPAGCELVRAISGAGAGFAVSTNNAE